MAKVHNQVTMNIHPHSLLHIRPLRISSMFDVVHIPLPRPRTLFAATLVLCGPVIVMLMLLGILPLSLLIGFIGFATTAVGSILVLIFYGEI